MENQELTHINEQGRARMVDVTQKDVTFRQAQARRHPNAVTGGAEAVAHGFNEPHRSPPVGGPAWWT